MYVYSIIGNFLVESGTNMVSVSTQFKGLALRPSSSSSSSSSEQAAADVITASLKLKTKRLSNALQARYMSPLTAMACIIKENCLVLHMTMLGIFSFLSQIIVL